MGMSEMRGALADAIRDSHVPRVTDLLKKYHVREEKEFLESRRDKELKDAVRLAKMVLGRSKKILDALEDIRKKRPKKR